MEKLFIKLEKLFIKLEKLFIKSGETIHKSGETICKILTRGFLVGTLQPLAHSMEKLDRPNLNHIFDNSVRWQSFDIL